MRNDIIYCYITGKKRSTLLTEIVKICDVYIVQPGNNHRKLSFILLTVHEQLLKKIVLMINCIRICFIIGYELIIEKRYGKINCKRCIIIQGSIHLSIVLTPKVNGLPAAFLKKWSYLIALGISGILSPMLLTMLGCR